jgi:hypothetical protein
MGKTTDPYALQALSLGLAALATHLEPREAAEVCGQAAATLTQAMNKRSDVAAMLNLSRGLAAVSARLKPEEAAAAAAALTQATSTTRDPNILASLLQRLSAVLWRRSEMAVVAAQPEPRLPFAAPIGPQPALEALSPPLPAQTLVDLLKQPFCVGEARRLVLNQLARHYQRPFADQWEFVDHVHQHKLDLDLTTPPQRSEAR